MQPNALGLGGSAPASMIMWIKGVHRDRGAFSSAPAHGASGREGTRHGIHHSGRVHSCS
jgi:hypothetical protein